jgi:hypothetical protein
VGAGRLSEREPQKGVRLSNAPVVRLGLVVDLSYERSGIST